VTRALALSVALSIPLSGALLHARADSDFVARGIAAYEALEVPHAVELLEHALASPLPRAEQLRALRTLALCHAALDDDAGARRDFEALLAVDPTWQPDPASFSPRVRALFEQARSPALRPELSPAEPQAGDPVTVRVPARPGADRVVVFHRAAGQPLYDRAASESGRLEITLPGGAARPPGLEYYVSLLDAQGAQVASAGTFDAPLKAPVGSRTANTSRAPLVLGVVAVILVVGAAIAVGAALAGSSSETASLRIIPH
jgi:hypothetical protein